MAVAFDFIAQWTKSRSLATAAYFNLLLAACFTVPVVATGLAAWQWALEAQKLKGILLMHLVLGCISAVVIWVVFLIHLGARRLPEKFVADVSPVSGSRRRPSCRRHGTPGRVSQRRERARLVQPGRKFKRFIPKPPRSLFTAAKFDRNFQSTGE